MRNRGKNNSCTKDIMQIMQFVWYNMIDVCSFVLKEKISKNCKSGFRKYWRKYCS